MPKIIPVFISYAGCPHQCAFCNQHAINSQQEFSLAAVHKQINKYLAYYPKASAKQLAFYGGSFTAIPVEWQEAFLALAKALAVSDNVTKIRMSTRPDYIDEQVVARLQKYSVDLVELGVQSLDNDVLRRANRGHDSKAVDMAVKLLQAAGIAFGIQLMAGLPGQSWQSIRETTKQVIAMQPDAVRIYPLVVFAGTDFAVQYKHEKLELLEFEEVLQQIAYMAEQFALHGINVIRIGLQEDDGLQEQGAILGGFHHPAYGELVASCLYRQKLIRLLSVHKKKNLTLLIPRRQLSQAIGHKKMNLQYFQQHYPDRRIIFAASDNECLQILSGDVHE